MSEREPFSATLHSGLEVDQPHSNLEHYKPVTEYADQEPQMGNWPPGPQPIDRRVCGLKRSTFAIVVIIALAIIIAGALGGGLGGGLSKKDPTTSTSQPSAACATSSPSNSNATTTIPSPNLLDSIAVGNGSPSNGTLIRDCPSANNSLYTIRYSAITYDFRKMCGIGLSNSANTAGQNINAVNTYTSSLDDCIKLCAAWNGDNLTPSNANGACSAVCWRYSVGSDLPGQCFGYVSGNVSGTFVIDPQTTECDSAAWINQS